MEFFYKEILHIKWSIHTTLFKWRQLVPFEISSQGALHQWENVLVPLPFQKQSIRAFELLPQKEGKVSVIQK